MMKQISFLNICLLVALICFGFASAADQNLSEHAADRLLIGTTTSLDATKLLDNLSATFEETNGVDVQWVAVGTGQALGYGRSCDVDVVMVHDRAAEDLFIDEGYGLDRRIFGYNYFLVVGPEADPAGIKGMKAGEAFKLIGDKSATDNKIVFVSRGDNSGTHSREKLIWKSAGFDTAVINTSPWYKEAGAGMGTTLEMANELGAYTLADESTWNTYKSNLTLVSLVEGGNELLNVYAVMRVNPDKCPDAGINVDVGKKWIDFMTSDEVQNVIEIFGTEKTGKPLYGTSRGNAVLLNVTEEEISSPVE